jgi:rhodanese-related sulfurtransferase
MIQLLRRRVFLVALGLAGISSTFAGCGTNKFQQELQTEEAAIKLTGETINGGYELISTSDLKKLLDGDQKLLLVDAMPAAESYDKGHIAGAVNFEFPKEVMDEWNKDTMGDRTKEDYEKLLGEDKQKQIVVYCGFVKCARSHNATIYARELGYTNVKRYPGGIHAWRGAGYALTTD